MAAPRPAVAAAPPPTLAWLLLGALVLIWGSSFILIKKGVEVFTPEQVGTLRIFSASAVLWPFALRNLRRVSRGQWKFLVVVGLTGSFVPAVLFSIAGKYIDSALSGALNALTPLFTLMVGLSLFGQRFEVGKMVGLVIGLVGALVLILLRGEQGFSLDLNAYALLPVVASFCYGLNLNVTKRFLSELPPLTVTTLSLLTVGPVAGVYLFSTDFIARVGAEGSGLPLLYVLLLGVLGTAFALVMLNRIIQLSNAVFASSVTYLIPIVAVGWGVLDGEKLFWAHFVGLAAILGGVLLINRRR